MPKIELTIENSYRNSWGLNEGIRELIANARDAEIQDEAPMTIDHVNDTLRIENENVTLARNVLLLGYSTKRDRSDMIGQFGEGFSLSILALVRAGYKVKIRSGGEVWTPTIEKSEKFGADVLKFDIAEGRKEENRVRIEVSPISKEAWENIKKRFLFLQKLKDGEYIKTSEGTLLMGENFRGKTFVKGVLVEHIQDLEFGYDLSNARTDVERRIVDSYDRETAVRHIWEKAIGANPKIFSDFYALLEKQSKDAEGIHGWSANYLDDSIVDSCVERFQKQFGENAIPVRTTDESRQASFYGKLGVVVSKSLGSILEKRLGSFEKNKTNLAKECIKVFSWHELTKEEQDNLEFASKAIFSVRPGDLSIIDVVEFRDKSIEGMASLNDGRIKIAKSSLNSKRRATLVLVHELAHSLTKAGDGTQTHTMEIQNLWADIQFGKEEK